ncbi:MAG: hypothetical protein JW708_11445 [Vallitaleaceae bacterium]|nr:hypothetical protein [Vallitaleaceae bacterium]
MKKMIKKLRAELVGDYNPNHDQLFRDSIEACDEILVKFHLYSLGLKYYAYLERNIEDEELCEHEDCHHAPLQGIDEIEDATKLISKYMTAFREKAQLPTFNELYELRESLFNTVKVLTAYGDYISLLENFYYKTRYSEEKLLPMDSDEEFSRKVVEKLMAMENTTEIREHLKYIYPELPMRMHKNRFYSILDEYFQKLQGIPFEDVKNHIQVLKETYSPESVLFYEEIGEWIAKELRQVAKVFADGNESDMDSAYHHLYHLTDDKNKLLDKALDLAELLNHLLGIALSTLDSMEENTVYHSIKKIFTLETPEEELFEVFHGVEEEYEKLGEGLMEIGQVIDLLLQKKEDYYNEDNDLKFNELRFSYELTREGYFIDKPYEKDQKIPSYQELNFLKQDVINLIEEVSKEEHRYMKRARMSQMMSILQLVHGSGQEIYDYIYGAISSCDNLGEKVMAMQNIYSYMSDLEE